MKKYFNYVGRSVTAKGTAFLLTGSILSQGVGFLVIALLTRNLDPAAFGLFITAFAFSQLITDLFELGINPAVLAFASGKKDKELYDHIKTSFLLKLGITIVMIGSIFFTAPFIARYIFNNSEILPYIQISAVGSSIMLLVVWGQSVLNIENKFLLSSLINSTTNIFRFVVVGSLVLFHLLSPMTSYFFFQIAIIFSLILFFIVYGFQFLKGDYKTSIAKKIFIFGIPIGLSFSVGAITARLDQILVFNMLGNYEAGVYGLGYRLVSIFILGLSAFAAVITPRFAALEESDYQDYFRKTFYVIFAMIGAIILAILVSPLMIPLIFGTNYQSAVLLFQILAVGVIFFILQTPFTTAIVYRKKRSNFLVPYSLISLGMMYLLLLYLIPIFQTNGAAIAFLVVNLLQLLFYIIYFSYLRKRVNL